MTFQCQEALPLVPSYLDGELSEAQAGLLRRHLMDCQGCRAAVQADKSLKRWFVPQAALEIPGDFAAHVARRAFAGDTGEEPAPFGTAAGEGRLLQFVLRATAVAAVVLIVVSVSIRALTLPRTGDLRADDRVEMQLEQHLDELERLNAEDETAPRGAGREEQDAR